MTDIIDRLQEIADLKLGDDVPQHLCEGPERWNWAIGMSRLLNDAITEIRLLRAQVKDRT